MEKQTEDRKRLTSTNNDLVEDLVDWAGKLKAMGGILASLAWHVKQDGDATQLIQCGEAFGEVIQNYAEFIETAVNDNIALIRSGQQNVAEKAGLKRISEMV